MSTVNVPGFIIVEPFKKLNIDSKKKFIQNVTKLYGPIDPMTGHKYKESSSTKSKSRSVKRARPVKDSILLCKGETRNEKNDFHLSSTQNISSKTFSEGLNEYEGGSKQIQAVFFEPDGPINHERA